jgi:hypothetical protein
MDLTFLTPDHSPALPHPIARIYKTAAMIEMFQPENQ